MLDFRPSPALATAFAALLALIALCLTATAATASVSPLAATLEGDGFAEFSQTNVETGSLAVDSGRAFDGGTSARATYNGGGENGYSRGIWDVQWNDGEDVWFGAAYYLPVGFHSNIQGQVDLVRWDNWVAHPSDTDWGGVSIYGSDHHARLLRFGAGRPNDTLVGPFDLPEGRWFTLQVHEHLSNGGDALSELYLDGALVGRSTKPNTYGRGIERIRYGIVAIAEDDQLKPLDLWFDKATAGPEPAEAVTSVRKPSFTRLSRPRGRQRCAPRRHHRHGTRSCRVRPAVAAARAVG